MKALVAVILMLLCAVLFGWYDPFHLVIGVPLLVGAGGLLWYWRKRNQDEDEEEEELEDEGDGIGHQIFMGVLGGGACLILLAAGFTLASQVGIADVFYGSDCQQVLGKIQTLEEAGAYGRIVEVIDDRLLQKTSAKCRDEMTEKKVRALLGKSDQAAEREKEVILRQALKEAEPLDKPDLMDMVAYKINALKKDGVINQQRKELDELKKMLEQMRDVGLPTKLTDEGVVVTLDDILFESGEAELGHDAKAMIERMVRSLDDQERRPDMRVEGHTDSTGSDEMNQWLSEARAASVEKVLIGAGVGQDRITAIGHGSRHPIASNETPEGRKKNRRVEITILT